MFRLNMIYILIQAHTMGDIMYIKIINCSGVIQYIRLFTHHVFPHIPPKPCIKSTRINISQNHSKSLNLPDLQETVSNLRECIFHYFDILANKAENLCTRNKTWYTVLAMLNNIKRIINMYEIIRNNRTLIQIYFLADRSPFFNI